MSAHKNYSTLVSTVAAVIVLAGLALFSYNYFMSRSNPAAINANLPTEEIEVGSTTIQVEVASTEAEREQGLSDRVSLNDGTGMLFVFQQDGDWGFWMKDMSFALDMVFISATQMPNVGSVVKVYSDVSPATYNAQNPQSSEVFYPPLAVRYVLELPAGYAAAHGIVQDSKVVLQ